MRLNSLIQTVVRISTKIYDVQPKTVKYIILKNPKFYPNLSYEVGLKAILAIFESLEKVPLIITVRERAESWDSRTLLCFACSAFNLKSKKVKEKKLWKHRSQNLKLNFEKHG